MSHVNGRSKPVTKEQSEWILEHVYYDETSPTFLRWKNMFHKPKNDKPAMIEITKDGYYRGQACGRRFQAHRVSWFLNHGYWPDESQCIDHIDGVRTNNAKDNLRVTSYSENQQNRDYKDVLGGYFESRVQRYHSRIKINGVTHFLGYFDTPEECRAAYGVAKQHYHSTGVTTRSVTIEEVKRFMMIKGGSNE